MSDEGGSISDEQGQSRGTITHDGVGYIVTVHASGVDAPDDAVLAAAGKEWERLAYEGKSWHDFTVKFTVDHGPLGSYAVTIQATSPDVGDADAAEAAAAFVEKVDGSTQTSG